MIRYMVLLLLILFIGQQVYSQGYIDESKGQVKRRLNRDSKKNKSSLTIQESGNSISFSFRDSITRPLDIVVHFNDKGKCIEQVETFDCDSCGQKFMKYVLAIKSYKWKKINANMYYSKYSLHRSFGIRPVDNNKYSFYSKRLYLTRKQYKEMLAGRECCAEPK